MIATKTSDSKSNQRKWWWYRVPYSLGISLKNWLTLTIRQGQLYSAWHWRSVGANHEPIPWYTYSSVEYLQQLDLSSRTVFEYGSGMSTLFWAKAARHVVSVEHDRDWFELIKPKLPSNVTYIFAEDEPTYLRAIEQCDAPPDIIIIDGEYRRACCNHALKHLTSGGLIILDNADWFSNSAAALRDADLLEVDFTGFGPINGYRWTTAMFFHREFRAAPKSRQPLPGVGAVIHQAD